MPTAQSVKLVDQLQQSMMSDAEELLAFHGNQKADLSALLDQIRNKDADEEARTRDMLERIEEMKTDVLAQRKSSKEFAAKVIDWLEAQLTAVTSRMDADSGVRQPTRPTLITPAKDAPSVKDIPAKATGKVAEIVPAEASSKAVN